MKTIKVIDLLNKIANGEEVPKKFKIKENYYKDRIYSYNEEYRWFEDSNDSFHCKDNISFDELNDEVEIIEDTPKEDKKIEKIQLSNGGLTIHTGENNDYTLSVVHKEIIKKINEIIDKINGE